MGGDLRRYDTAAPGKFPGKSHKTSTPFNVSVRWATVSLCVSMILITVSISLSLSISTGNSALTDTEESCSQGLTESRDSASRGQADLLSSGEQNILSIASRAITKAADEAVARIMARFQVPRNIVRSLLEFMFTNDMQMTHDYNFINNTLRPLMYAMHQTAMPNGVTEVGLIAVLPRELGTFEAFEVGKNKPWWVGPPEGRGRPCGGHPQGDEMCCSLLTPTGGIAMNCFVAQVAVMMFLEDPRTVGRPEDEFHYVTSVEYNLAPSNTYFLGTGGEGVKFGLSDSRGYIVAQDPYNPFGPCPTDDNLCAGFNRNATDLSFCAKEMCMNYGCDFSAPLRTNGQTTSGRCNVPNALEKLHPSMERALMTDPANNIRASPLENKGAYLSQVYASGWGKACPAGPGCEEPPCCNGNWLVLNDKIGFVYAATDITAVSAFLQEIAATMPSGTRLYAVGLEPAAAPGMPTWAEKPHGGSGTFGNLAGYATDTRAGAAYTEEPGVATVCMLVEEVQQPAGLYRRYPDGLLRPKNTICCCTTNDCMGELEESHTLGNDGDGCLCDPTHDHNKDKVHCFNDWIEGLPFRKLMNATDTDDAVIRRHARETVCCNDDQYAGLDVSAEAGLLPWFGPAPDAPRPAIVSGEALSCPTLCAEAASTDGKDEWWTKARAMEDAAGLNMRVVMLVHRDTAMAVMDAATLQVQNDITQRNEEVNQGIARRATKVSEDKDAAFLTMYIGVAIATVLLVGVAVWFASVITAPLRSLSHDMAAVAKMELDGVDLDKSHLSHLSEVKKMQKSFHRMVNNMKELRNFMPQSLQIANDDDDESIHDGDTEIQTVISQKSKRTGKTGKTGASSHQSGARGRGAAASSMASSVQSAAMRAYLSKVADAGVKKKKCSMHIVNIVSWHKILEHGSHDAGNVHSSFLTVCLKEVTLVKGVTDTFMGDRLTNTYNACKPLGVHRTALVNCSFALNSQIGAKAGVERSDTHGSEMSLSQAGTTGPVQCGNMGCPGLKKFSVMSTVVTYAYALERFARHIGAQSLVIDNDMAEDARNTYTLRTLGKMNFPKRSQKGPMCVFEVMTMKEVSEEEWMYQLEEGQAAEGTYASWTEAVAKLEQGDHAAANALVLQDKALHDMMQHGSGQWLKRLLDEQGSAVTEMRFH